MTDIIKMTKDEWEAEGIRLFGPDKKKWRFVCPACGYVASIQDWIDAGAIRSAAFSCVGRWMKNPREAFGEGPGPCNYAGAGLFAINPVEISIDGKTQNYFDFDRSGK